MKPEEVNAMTDEQLRIKAAELLGMSNTKVGGMAIVGIQPNGEMRCIPDYPNEISAAWRLIRALPEDMTMTIYTGRMVILEQSEMYELAGGGIAAPLYSEIARFIGDSDERNITKAFIIAMGEKK